MKTVCEANKCAGCMACKNICAKNAITIVDNISSYNAVINEDLCIDCNACKRVCPQNNPPSLTYPIEWNQGWAEDENVRLKSSSGGLATAISKAFIENGGVVYSCTFNNGEFIFDKTEKLEDVEKFVGSKYVKSNPHDVYKKIKEDLKNGGKVLFIGLPCQVAGLNNIIGKIYKENLYTIDLICHGTPSPKVLDIFLKQYGVSLSKLKDISFRSKAKFQIYGDYKGIITKGVTDRYSIAFLNSLTYTENCYSCQYATINRVSDLTLGDSWGSELSEEEKSKGISLALCQTPKGKELLTITKLHLENVDLEKAIESNHQLSHSSNKHEKKDTFFSNLDKLSFNKLVFSLIPKQCLRQDIKQFLIKTHISRIYRGG